MSTNEQNEYGPNGKRKTSELLPRFFRTTANNKFLQATLDQLTQPGVAEKIDGYFGRKNAKAFTPNDNYVGDVSQQREDYQFEPAAVIKDDLGNVNFYKDYNDYINQIKAFNGNTQNHDKLNRQETYAWNPNIDWDKFANYREYYWLPNGPQPVSVYGESKEVVSTYTIELAEDDDNFAYVFSPDGRTRNPVLNLYRGQKYRFEINTPGHPIAFALSRSWTPGVAVITASTEGVRANALFDVRLYDDVSYDVGDFIVLPSTGGIDFGDDENVSQLYPDGIIKLGEEGEEVANLYIEKGTIEFTVPDNAPDRLYYISKNDIDTSGEVRIADIEENTFLNIDTILGKKDYSSANGIKFTNGLKIYFQGDITPEKYSKGQWYVEGVGDKIKLVSEDDLLIPTTYSEELIVPFDSNPFDVLPFGSSSTYAANKDYVVINKASQDRNPWSRYNRWFHREVIEQAAAYNTQPVNVNEDARAKRPIIEFKAGLKLFNFGSAAKDDVDLVDDFTTDVFSIIEGSSGYNIDGVDITQGMRILFTADTDILVKDKIYTVNFITIGNNRQVSLLETEDTLPQDLETVLVTNGEKYAGKTFSYENGSWNLSQEKINLNQPPLFDMCDAEGISYNDESKYESSSFAGTKIFSYKQGTGVNDTELGFPLSYKNIENSGDILFDFNLLIDSFTYQVQEGVFTVDVDTGFVKKYSDLTTYTYENGWNEVPYDSKQYVIRQYAAELGSVNNFEVDVYDKAGDLNDLKVVVYRNNKIQIRLSDYEIDRINGRAFVRFYNDLSIGDKIIIKTNSATTKNNNGYYEFPHNLERNPLNEDVSEFTLGEVLDHVDTMIEELTPFQGTYPGPSNLRDLGEIDRLGKRFVKHSGPINLPLYHITNKNNNMVKAIRFAMREYSKFKRNFVQTATDFPFDGPVKDHVDAILAELNKDKTKSMPFYFSDMIPVGPSRRLDYTVLDPRNPFYALTTPFTLDTLSEKAVQVYLNGNLLLHGRDYTFDPEGFGLLVAGQQEGDTVQIYEWSSTDGSFVPPTPTKLGLYPAYEPMIFVDDTHKQPVLSIQGHDGSIVRAFDDYRDQLILEFERRIYNNIKQAYNAELLDIHEFKGSNYRDTTFSRQDINDVLLTDFTKWLQLVDFDYNDNSFYDRNDQFTFNYSQMTSPNGKSLPGFWRGVYIEAYDTDRPHTHPWEMLGFTRKPDWWNEVYGPAPYTRNNLVLWKDLEEGIIREPGKAVIRKSQYARPGLLDHIPTDDSGKLLSPLASNFAKNYVLNPTRNNYDFGDHSPVENAWRKSSEYPFSLITAWILNQPAKLFGLGFDISRIKKNLANQYVYADTNKHIELNKIALPNTYEAENRVLTSGLVNYIYNLITSDVTKFYESYDYDLKNLNNQLGIKIAGFTDKPKFNLLLDSRSPNATEKGGIFVPQENYQIFLNTSSPVDTPIYSGVTVEKAGGGFIVRGYSFDNPFFNYFKPISTNADVDIVIGGVSENFVDWTENKRYSVGQIVRNNNRFYRVTDDFTSTESFDTENLATLAELPITGGRRAKFRKVFNTRKVERINFGTLFRTVQEVVDFLLGYGKYLESLGFEFDYFNEETQVVENWDFSAREFLFWTTQNWALGSAVSLSPAASIIEFKSENSVVDNLFDNFYEYSILNSDGRSVLPELTHALRDENSFGLTFKNTTDGVYHLRLPLVQKEHVVLLDNKTQFNDIIYQKTTGYRQERIRVLGYRTDGWTGGFNIPGFVYDDAKITTWQPWTDYEIASIVKYKEFYYTANINITGTSTFESKNWQRLNSKPESELLTNFDYKINQFGDFYDLDSDNFDTEQQKLAQHLIGYQKRDYLKNIIKDDVSQYKFYQGFIQDKGTTNALTKLFDALGSADKDSLEFYEEWAIQLGQYGASTSKDYIEYELDEKEFELSPQPIELVNSIPEKAGDQVYRIRPFQVYDQSQEHGITPFPVVDKLQEYIKSSGYARADDVRYRVASIENVAGIEVNNVNLGDYIWVLDDLENNWTVLQLADAEMTVGTITLNDPTDNTILSKYNLPASQVMSLTLNRYPNELININDYIGMIGAEQYNANYFYKVLDISKNIITVQKPTDPEITSTLITEQYLPLVILRKVRAADINSANEMIQEFKDRGQKVWIDEYDTDWKVIENNPVYSSLQSINNPSQWDSTFHDFASKVTVSENNRDLIIGSPGELDGRVHYYFRNQERNNSVLQQTIVPPTDVIDSENNNYQFGQSVAVSPDGEYLAIGIPNATNVRTRFKGEFSDLGTYNKAEIVKYRESYWRANREILPKTGGQEFTTFNSYLDILNADESADSSVVRLLLTGDPQLPNSEVDHFLVRANQEQYLASSVGDTLGLTWNRFSRANGNLNETLPWDGDAGLTYDIITGNHIIAAKVDVIFYIPTFVGLPVVGDFVTTATGSAEVVYVGTEADGAVIYANNQNGTFQIEGNLFIGDDELVGAYSTAETDNLIESLGGFWKIDVAPYDNGNTWFDQGKGLIYNDLRLATESRDIFEYYNVQNIISGLGSGLKQKFQGSQIINLKYQDDPDAPFPNTINSEDLLGAGFENVWVIRGAKNYTDTLSISEKIRLTVYDLDNYVIDVESAGFTFDQLNKEHEVLDLWDGFIDLEYTEFDFIGNTFNIEVGDTIEDVQYPFDIFGGVASTPYAATSTGEVVYVQTFFNSARVYLKNITGTWETLNNVARYKVKRLGNEDLRGLGDPDRVSATIEDPDNGIALGTNNVQSDLSIGKLIVLQSDTPLGLPTRPYAPNIQTELAYSSAAIVDEEYWFFNIKQTVGVGREASFPHSLNKDYSQVYSIPVSEFGEASYYNEGVVALYRKGFSNDYEYMNSIVSESRQNAKGFGEKVEFIQNGLEYKLFITSKGDGAPGNNGTLEVIKHGVPLLERDNYVGDWIGQRGYDKGTIVSNLGKFYRAIRDVPDLDFGATVFVNNTVYWEDYSWRYGKDPDYRGLFNNNLPYVTGELVSHPIDDSTLATPALYRALTNIAVGAVSPVSSPNAWERVTDGVDYLGSLPNRSGTTFLDNEEVFDPTSTNSYALEDTLQFAESFAVNKTGDVLAIVSKQTTDSTPSNVVVIYRLVEDKYMYDQVITTASLDKTDISQKSLADSGFAQDVQISPDGLTIAVSHPFSEIDVVNQGTVHIYSQQTVDGKAQFVLNQTLQSPKKQESEKFGYSIALDNKQLAITSVNGDITLPTTFDGDETSFDNNFTQFKNVQYDSGVVYVYENVGGSFLYSEQFVYKADKMIYFGEYLEVKGNHIYVGIPRYRPNESEQGLLVDFRKNISATGWNVIREPNPIVDVDKIRSVYLYNKVTKNIVTYLDYVDSIQGKIPGPAEQELQYKLPYDPARYNITPISDLYSETNHWGPAQVGELWWDLSSARFLHAYQGDIIFQNNNFNLMNPGKTVDVYEWVESDLIPSEWDNISDTETGLQAGISGQSLYSDTLYVQKINYDAVSQTFGSKFYFWVKNKKTVPVKESRSLSALDTARLIQDPSQQGYRHISFLSNDKFVLHNCNSLINDKDVVLHIDWLSGSDPKQNTHTQYQIMSEGLDTSRLNADIERKWFDSLVGYDEKLRIVPDPSLPIRQRYGNRFKPRQTMFVNKTEALKQVIERINDITAKNLIADDYDISNLSQAQNPPSEFTFLYDTTIDTEQELRFVGTSKVTKAELEPVISNGEIVRVNIINPGRGYRIAPSYTINGTGSGAEVEFTINNLGQITSVEVVNGGKEYENNTTIDVRYFSVLVSNDSTVYGKWSIYSWNDVSKEWFRQQVQEFDVSLFWDYIDYYADGFNQFTKIDYEIDQSYELFGLDVTIGGIVKINNIGSGGWLLLQKVADEDTEDFTINYDTIGRQNGTIQFKSSLYDLLGNSIGYDTRSFDSYFYDSQPIKETRIILETIRDSIFVGTLAVEYNKLWFASLRYVFAEQILVDWAFKTSFVKSKHNLGELEQDITFNADTLPDYESYIDEVKPFSTTIREFVSAYDALDNTASAVTDFDLTPIYDPALQKIVSSTALVVDDTVVAENLPTNEYPRKYWKDNFGYEVKEIIIANPGSEYTFPPTVTISGGGGQGATARAFIGQGKVTKIEILNPGTGYISQPTVTIQGSQSDTGTPASASVVLGNGVVRSTKVKIKFDRIKGSYLFTALDQSESFVGTGDKTNFDLEWPMNLQNTLVKVYVDNRELLRSEYRFENIDNNDKSYTRQQGRIIFTKPPVQDQAILVEYFKPLSMLDAADRIYNAYTPTSGMAGAELGQLMDGVDYGGVEVKGFDFTRSRGWDSDNWYDGAWDPYEETFEDEVFTFDGSTVSITLSRPLEDGVVYNVYFGSGIGNELWRAERIDDPNFDSAERLYDGVVINPITGDGVTDTIYLDELGIVVTDGDVIIIRKQTSDGSFAPDPTSYDTQLSGGDLVYSTATGLNPEDIIIDGDGFVTPTTSKGPEELVPGQLVDTLDLKVYTREGAGQGEIYSQSYTTDGVTTTFDLGVIPNNPNAVLVKLDNVILPETEYTIDWEANTITLNSVADAGKEFNIITVSGSAQNILDSGTIIADGTSAEYIVPIEYIDTVSVFATIDGVKVEDLLVINNADTGNIALRFDTILAANVLVRYVVFYDNTQINYSQMTKEDIVSDGSTLVYDLANQPLYQDPTAYNTIIKTGNTILNAGYNIQYTISELEEREFQLELFQQPLASVDTDQIQVYLNGEKLTFPRDYAYSIANSAVTLTAGVGTTGDIVEIYVKEDGDYFIEGNQITFATAIPEDQVIEIYTFTNHDILGIERINYDVVNRTTLTAGTKEYGTYHSLTSGVIKLRKPAVNVKYVWLSLNGELLTPAVDYSLNDDKTEVHLAQTPTENDVIDIIHFSADIGTERFAFRQFKDMLNRTHFKRLDSPETELAQDLNWYDIRIEVLDGAALPEPNKGENMPGIVFINGERIEYFVKEDNTLRQIRRGTLGTGVANVHRAGEGLYDQGPGKTIPYQDTTITQTYVGDGETTEFSLNYTPSNTDEFEVFVAGRRLRKNSISAFDYTIALDSTEGDATLPAEFTIDSNTLTLTEAPLQNTQILVIRKVGKIWSPTGTQLAKAENDIARFLRAGTIKLSE